MVETLTKPAPHRSANVAICSCTRCGRIRELRRACTCEAPRGAMVRSLVGEGLSWRDAVSMVRDGC